MKNILLLLIIISTFFLSCPSEIIKKTSWKGTCEGDFGQPNFYEDEHDFRIYFNNDSTFQAYIILEEKDGTKSDKVYEGTYSLDNNYNFNADGENEESDAEFNMTGILNTSTGIGYGDYEFKFGNIETKDDWEMTKVY